MMTVDSSVVIAGFANWHEHHTVAHQALTEHPSLVAHAAVEAYSVLTRLPPPHRAQPAIIQEFIAARFTNPFLVLSDTGYQELLAAVASGQVTGGQTYDALIAFTAAEYDATLLSLDKRASLTYESMGATVEQLG